MNPGRLSDEITIQQPSLVDQPNGQPLVTWSTYAVRLADVTTPTVTQFRAASREIKQGGSARTMRQNQWLVRIRHDPDVSSAMRVRWLDHIMDIEGITADPKNAVYMFLHCIETAPTEQGFGELIASPNMRVTIGGTEYIGGETYDFGNLVRPTGATISVTVDNGDGMRFLALAVLLTGDSQFATTSPSTLLIPADLTESIPITVTNPAGQDQGQYSATLTLESNDPNVSTFTLAFTYTCV